MIGVGAMLKFFNSIALNRLWSMQSFRFYFIGGVNAVLGITLMAIFADVFNGQFSYSIIYTLTYILVLGISYFSQRVFVWNSKNPVFKEVVRYLGASLTIYSVNLFILVEIVEKNHLPFVLSQIIIGLFLALLTFIVSKFWVFIRK